MAYSQNAVRRVQHDMRELQRERVPGLVAAAPADPKDLLVWSVTMRAECGPLEGCDIRMRLSLPPDYPDSPPDVCLLDEIPNHPNVFGDWICLDMLKSPDYYSKPYQGWSAAYSLAGVLQGLYGFLLVDDSVDQMYGGPARSLHTHHAAPPPRPTATVFDAVLRASPALTPTLSPSLSPRASQAAAAAALPDSGAGDDRAASLPSALLQAVQLGGAEAGAAVHDGALEVLDDHLLGHVLANLTPQDLWRCSAAGSARLQQCARDTLQRQELVCFHSKATFRDAVLGFGVHREWHASRPGQPLGALRDAVVRLDYLSLDAFATRGVKRSAWNAPLDAFLPLYLNPEHGERALRALPACLAHLSTSRGALSISTLPASVLSSASTSSSSPSSSASRPSSSTTRPDAAAITGMDPRQLLTVLAQLVKSLVVQIVMLQDQQAASRSRQQQAVPDWRRREDPATGNVPTHMSEAALHGFAHLHHLLLAVALAPGGERLLALARGDLEAFCDRPQARHKAQCPDLGVLLVELLLVPKEAVPWSRLMPSLLRELLARQVRWIVRDVGEQAFGVVAGEDLDGASDASFRRMKTHFEKAGTSMRTVLLTCWFSNELARPATVAGAVRELGAIKRAYDATSGLPPPRAGARFHTFAREVLRTGSWGAFLAALRVAVLAVPGCDARGMWARVLRQAVVDSWVQGYHNSPTPWREGTQCRLTPLPRLPRELPATAAASGGGGRGGEGDAAREAPAVKSSGWTEVARAARQPAVASVARAPVRTAPVHSVWPWGPNERLRHAAQNVLGCPFVDWATQPPVRALEGPDAW